MSLSSFVVLSASSICALVTGYIVIGTLFNQAMTLDIRLHITFASIGSFFFMPIAFMIFAFKLKDLTKRKLHVWFASLGMLFIIASMIVVYYMKEHPMYTPSEDWGSDSSTESAATPSSSTESSTAASRKLAVTGGEVEHYESLHGKYGVAAYIIGSFVTIAGVPIMYFTNRIGATWTKVLSLFHRFLGGVTFLLWVLSNYYSQDTWVMSYSTQFAIFEPQTWGRLFVCLMLGPFFILYNPWMHPKLRNKIGNTFMGKYLLITPVHVDNPSTIIEDISIVKQNISTNSSNSSASSSSRARGLHALESQEAPLLA